MSTVPQATLSEAIASVPNKRSTAAPTSRHVDDQFFLAMGIFILGTVFLGFARTFYLAGIYHTHLPNRLIAVHGTVFTAWVVLLVVQTGLVAGRRIAVHRALGLFGAVLAASMVVLGLAAATDSLARGFAPPGFPLGPRVFYATPVFAMITFATLIGAGLWMRSNGPAHKRLVLLATITLLPAAIGRWPFAVMSRVHFSREFNPLPIHTTGRCLRSLVSSSNSSCDHARWHFPNTHGESCGSGRSHLRMAEIRWSGTALLARLALASKFASVLAKVRMSISGSKVVRLAFTAFPTLHRYRSHLIERRHQVELARAATNAHAPPRDSHSSAPTQLDHLRTQGGPIPDGEPIAPAVPLGVDRAPWILDCGDGFRSSGSLPQGSSQLRLILLSLAVSLRTTSAAVGLDRSTLASPKAHSDDYGHPGTDVLVNGFVQSLTPTGADSPGGFYAARNAWTADPSSHCEGRQRPEVEGLRVRAVRNYPFDAAPGHPVDDAVNRSLTATITRVIDRDHGRYWSEYRSRSPGAGRGLLVSKVIDLTAIVAFIRQALRRRSRRSKVDPHPAPRDAAPHSTGWQNGCGRSSTRAFYSRTCPSLARPTPKLQSSSSAHETFKAEASWPTILTDFERSLTREGETEPTSGIDSGAGGTPLTGRDDFDFVCSCRDASHFRSCFVKGWFLDFLISTHRSNSRAPASPAPPPHPSALPAIYFLIRLTKLSISRQTPRSTPLPASQFE